MMYTYFINRHAGVMIGLSKPTVSPVVHETLFTGLSS